MTSSKGSVMTDSLVTTEIDRLLASLDGEITTARSPVTLESSMACSTFDQLPTMSACWL